MDLPDPNDELVAYLPSRILDADEGGLSQRKAMALCRRLVAVHCLYGVDKNPLAVELAKVSLWLESYAEGLPLTFLDHRLICGDSLTGPFVEHLFTFPGSGKPVETNMDAGLNERLHSVLEKALQHVMDLETSVGKDVADLELKRAAKAQLDVALAPFRLLAAAWTGGVMLGEGCDDEGYHSLIRAIADGESGEDTARRRANLGRMIDFGRHGVAYDIIFPEVFHPTGERNRVGGFNAIVGNPPWDALQPYAKEFFAAFDLRVLDAPTKNERDVVERRLSSDREVKNAFDLYVGEVESAKRILDALFKAINRTANDAPSGAAVDLWQPFAERGVALLQPHGRVGLVVPSAFHANQSATGLRELYLTKTRIACCYSFENRKKLFEIHASFKFATLVAEIDGLGTKHAECAFYLHDLDWLETRHGALRYSRAFVERTGGAYRSFAELRNEADAAVMSRCYESGVTYVDLAQRAGVRTGEEMHMTKASHLFTDATQVCNGSDARDPNFGRGLLAAGYVPLHEGKTFHQFDDRWADPPRYLVALDAVRDKLAWTRPSRFYRAAFRDIASATNERTGI
ncbi:MAG TPA: hypothetical protein PLI95_27560, partial [Polyangiaceae bacterium]|nr:hypothetical protein [Polyangiaceae bacterium]